MPKPRTAQDLLRSLRPGEEQDVPDRLPGEAGPPSVVDVKGFLAMIEMMREHHRYGFADGTLVEIYDTVEKTKAVTQEQLTAVRNIRHSVRGWEDCDVEDV